MQVFPITFLKNAWGIYGWLRMGQIDHFISSDLGLPPYPLLRLKLRLLFLLLKYIETVVIEVFLRSFEPEMEKANQLPPNTALQESLGIRPCTA
jgi:hypothetical protein